MVGAGKHAVLRVIAETGEALGVYMSENFRDLPCARVEMDEQWQYVGKHGQRMKTKEEGRGDFWLWCAIDPDTKLVLSFSIGRRTRNFGEDSSTTLPSACGPACKSPRMPSRNTGSM